MNKVSVVIGIVAIAVILFLGYMVFNQQQQIDDLSNAVEENQLQAEIDKEELKDQIDRKSNSGQYLRDFEADEEAFFDRMRRQEENYCKDYPKGC